MSVELDINPKVTFQGEWRLQIVNSSTGKSIFPFGGEMRENTILNVGKHAIAGIDSPAFGKSQTDKTCLAELLAGNAYVGTDATPSTASQTGIIGTSYQSLQTTPGYVFTTENTSDSMGRTFKVSWDFNPVASPVSLNEACIESSSTYCQTAFKFSRFVFPATVTLDTGQFIRLEYALTVKIDAFVNPIRIEMSSGDFIGDGYLKLVGTYNDIFGAISGTGPSAVTVTRPADYPGRGCLPIHRAPSSGITYAGACMVISTINPLLPVVFPTVGVGPNISMIGSRITQADRAVPIAYDSGSFTRSCRYTFIAGNPYADTDIGGIMFSSQGSSGTTYLNYGWLWAFDALQVKSSVKSISVVLNQTVL